MLTGSHLWLNPHVTLHTVHRPTTMDSVVSLKQVTFLPFHSALDQMHSLIHRTHYIMEGVGGGAYPQKPLIKICS